MSVTGVTITPGNFFLEAARITIDGTDIGATKGGFSVKPNISRVVATCDQHGDTPVKSWNKGVTVQIKFGLLETSYANLLRILHREATSFSTGGTAVGLGGKYAGEITSTKAIIARPVTTAAGDGSRDITIPKAVMVDVDEIKVGPDQEIMFMTTWEAELDTTLTRGKQMATFGLNTAT